MSTYKLVDPNAKIKVRSFFSSSSLLHITPLHLLHFTSLHLLHFLHSISSFCTSFHPSLPLLRLYVAIDGGCTYTKLCMYIDTSSPTSPSFHPNFHSFPSFLAFFRSFLTLPLITFLPSLRSLIYSFLSHRAFLGSLGGTVPRLQALPFRPLGAQ